MKKIILLMTFCIALILFGTFQVYADSFMPPVQFEIWSADGTVVFRWNPPETADNWTFATAQAGVYRDGELLYEVANLPVTGISEHNFFFSQDFQHFMFSPTQDFNVALKFFTNGELIRTHYIADLVRDMQRVSYSVTMAIWGGFIGDTLSWFEHIAEHDILRVKTVDEIIYEFDLTTGAILNSAGGDNSLAWLQYGLFIATGVIFIGVIVIIVIKRRRVLIV